MSNATPINVSTPMGVVQSMLAGGKCTPQQFAEYAGKRVAYERAQAALEERQRKTDKLNPQAKPRKAIEYAIGTK